MGVASICAWVLGAVNLACGVNAREHVKPLDLSAGRFNLERHGRPPLQLLHHAPLAVARRANINVVH
eukprot:7118891-Lingulodinium_polyedra.AAC.1